MVVDCRWCGGAGGGLGGAYVRCAGAALTNWSRFAAHSHLAGGRFARHRRDLPRSPHTRAAVADRLFDSAQWPTLARRQQVPAADAPLAVRMRPRSLDELVGQEHVLGEGSALRTAIESGHPHSAILYGPPGSGKTTLARIAAAGAEGAFEEESAVNAGRAEIRAVIERARERRRSSGRPTVLVPRRDPSLQQGAAGRAACRRSRKGC